MELSTKEKLAWTAAKLFQEKGYNGVGLSEILAAAGVPKGSLYHHFPDGKRDLALEAAAFAHREMTRIIDDAFETAPDYRAGATTLFHKLAKLFELMGKHTGCPITHILFSGPDEDEFRAQSAAYFDAWTTQIAGHAMRFGAKREEAHAMAEHLFVVLQGGWTLARAHKDSDRLRGMVSMLFPGQGCP